MNTPIQTCRPLERAAVGVGVFVCALLVVCAAVNLYFHLSERSDKEKPAPIQGALK